MRALSCEWRLCPGAVLIYGHGTVSLFLGLVSSRCPFFMFVVGVAY